MIVKLVELKWLVFFVMELLEFVKLSDVLMLIKNKEIDWVDLEVMVMFGRFFSVFGRERF